MNTASIPIRRQNSWSGIAWKATLILIPLITAGGLLWLRQVEVRALQQRSVSSYGTVPHFRLVNQNGRPFDSALEKTDVHLVSFSVDPEKDTPDVLRGYGEKLHADPERWDFLTGPKSAIYKLSHDGFKLAVSDGSDEAGIPVHSTRMVLVDRHGQIRGYYEAMEADAVTKLLADTNHLLREQPK